MKLILFDIDGTIMDSGGAGSRSLDLAFKELFSIPKAFSGITMAGKTDLQIMQEALRKHNLPSENGAIPAVMEVYLRNLKREIGNDEKHLKPGIREALEAIRKEGDRYIMGLLTGNIEEGARIKLDTFDLNPYFPSGAFGNDHEDRNMLLPIAVKRFEALTGRAIEHRNCIIIGDTPRDVHCAKPYGAACIGVATGPYPKQDLVEAGADAVMDDLSRTAHLLEAIGDL
ncbi:MAG: HAD family hydrolase [Thermodesulfovibrionales bacterium]|jgi:phosphoglycolate phosphatase-like HAD superfamily hydrolase